MSKKSGHGEGRHIRFPDEQPVDGNEIHVLQIEDKANEYEVHAGFFKSDHKYEVLFAIPDCAGLGEDIGWQTSKMSSLSLSIKSLERKDTDFKIQLEYQPSSKVGVVKEFFSIVSNTDKTKAIRVTFRAEVLGRDQGTPMLKDGVRCIERPHSAESSRSD